MTDLLLISLTTSGAILVLLALTPLLRRRYAARWRCAVWLLLAVRLLIPVRLELPQAPVRLPPVIVSEPAAVPGEITSAPAAPAAPAPSRRVSAGDVIFAVWLIGCVAVALWNAVGYWRFRLGVRKHLQPVEPGVWRCGRVAGPMAMGFLRPMILLPAEDAPPGEVAAALAHERAHLRRGDLWYKLAFTAACAVHWFNPAVWLMARQGNRDLEYACDELVVRDRDLEYRKSYSRAIVRAVGRETDRQEGGSL